MVLEVEVISRECIKPSSATPDHLRKYPFSFLDQIAPVMFMPIILYYSADDDTHHNNAIINMKSNHLKKSLSQALTQFYPLAGRRLIDNNHYVDCNDEGALYFEARANCQLSDAISDPVPNELNKLLCELDDDAMKNVNLAIQVTFFSCGGMAISVRFSHKVGDALSLFRFTYTWAAIAHNGEDHHNIPPSPIYGSAMLFPPIDLDGYKTTVGTVLQENIVCKRFVFSASKIAALRDRLHGAWTRVEALSAFIWTRFMAATQQQARDKDHKKIYALNQAVNLRTRFDRPLPENYFGNIISHQRSVMSENDIGRDDEMMVVITKIREAIQRANVEKLQKGENDHLKSLKKFQEKFIKGELVSFTFTSLSKFDFYEADFGWGKPIWMGSVRMEFKHLVTFFGTKVGDGIEAWINLTEEDMAKFEVDKELLAFVSSI